MGFNVIAGEAALAAMTRAELLEEWRALYAACPWATSGQNPDFSRLRCEVYRGRALPVLVLQREAGALVGLLALAVQEDEEWTLGASCEDCEYHVWLAEPSRAESFMPGALEALSDQIDLPPLRLRYMPGDVALQWTKQGRWRLLTELRSEQTRVLRLEDRERALNFVKSKGRLRSKRNALARLGEVTFRRVVGISDFERILDRFDEMSLMRNVDKLGQALPIDPFKRAYLAARQAIPGMQHTTVLELDGNPIAAHIGIEGRPGGAFSLAGITHDVAYDKYSPGSLLLAELIPLLCDEGYRVFDLTPGGDAYKERWGDRLEPVYELRIYPTLASRGLALARAPVPGVMRRLRRITEQAAHTVASAKGHVAGRAT